MMKEEKKESTTEEGKVPLDKKKVPLAELEEVKGGAMKNTVRTHTEDITKDIKDRV